MAKKDSPIQKVTPPTGALTRPDYLGINNSDAVQSQLDALREFVVLPRIKIVQKSAMGGLLDNFTVSDIIESPSNMMIAPAILNDQNKPMDTGTPVFFTPLIFFVDYATWNPIELKGQLPSVHYYTKDRNDPIVAKSRDPKLRFEEFEHGGAKYKRRHVEQLNWIVQLRDHPLREPIILTFARSGHWPGQLFSGLVRKRKAAPFGCVFKLFAQKQTKNTYDWYNMRVQNPTETDAYSDGLPVSPWVSESEFAQMKTIFEEWDETNKTQGVKADATDMSDLEPGGDEVETGPRTM